MRVCEADDVGILYGMLKGNKSGTHQKTSTRSDRRMAAGLFG